MSKFTHAQLGEPTAVYPYHDEQHRLAYWVCRFEPKDFRPCRPGSGDTVIWNLEGVQRVPYRLLEFSRLEPGSRVFIAEGEKDVDTLRSVGLIATTNNGGAGKWRPDFGRYFKGLDVVIFSDSNEPGYKHAAQVAESVKPYAARVFTIRIGDAKDITELLEGGLTPSGMHREGMALSDLLESIEIARNLASIPRRDGGRPPTLQMIAASIVKERSVEWLWPARIPKSYVTFFSGDPGAGKSTIAVDLAARISKGGEWPDSGKAPSGAVLFMSSEDGYEDVLTPRLRVAGGDLTRIGFVTGKISPERPDVEQLANLKDDLTELEFAIPSWEASLGARILLLVVDPFMNYLGGVNPNKESEVRPLLAEVAAFLRRTGITLLGIRHLTKDEEKSLLYRAGGSIAFTGTARAEYLVGKDPEDETRRVFAQVKGSLGTETTALSYRIVEAEKDVTRIEWLGPTEATAHDVVGPKEKGAGQRERATKLLLELLGEGKGVESETVFSEAASRKIGSNTLRAAAKELGVEKRPGGFRGSWLWSLTREEA